ncbi:MAG: cupin domain-containing protein [Lachnospiraceae bacterium]|nr:cupin domain-containing protein [Lachnospiraceae bacterium]
MFVINSEKEYRDLGGGVLRKVLAYSDNIMNVELLFEKGAKGEMHSHPHEQIGYVIEGSLVFHEEGKEDVTLNTGDTYIVAPNVSHGIDCLTRVKLLDIFTPKREDFLK